MKRETRRDGDPMAEKDIAEKQLLSYADVFANLLRLGTSLGNAASSEGVPRNSKAPRAFCQRLPHQHHRNRMAA